MLTDLKHRFTGALLGVAAGDALGMPYEGMTAKEIINLGKRELKLSHITDDTQLTIIVADVLARSNELFDSGQFGKQLIEWLRVAVNPGKACVVAARRLRDGAGWAESGVMSAGCGAAMRAVPLGLRYFHSLHQLTAAAIASAVVTHTDRRAVAGAIAVAAATAWSIRYARAESVDDERFLRFVARACEPTSREMARLIMEAADMSPMNVSGTAMDVVPAACHWFLQYPDDFASAMKAAVATGGDTDSVAAITGGLVGARVGIKGIARKFTLLPEKAQIEHVAGRLFSGACRDVIRLLQKSAATERTKRTGPKPLQE